MNIRAPRFDPTITTGALLQAAVIVFAAVGLYIGMVKALGNHEQRIAMLEGFDLRAVSQTQALHEQRVRGLETGAAMQAQTNRDIQNILSTLASNVAVLTDRLERPASP